MDRKSGRGGGDFAQRVTDFYYRFSASVYWRAWSLLNDREEALEVTQESFTEFWKKFERVKQDSEAFALLMSIATNLSLTRLRQRNRWSKLVQGFAADLSPNGASETEMRRVEKALELAHLTRGESQRSMIVAVYYFADDCTEKEVADLVDLSSKQVRRLLDRFKKRAKKRHDRFKGPFE